MKKSLKILTVLCAAALSLAAVSICAGAVNTKTNYLRGDASGDGFVSIYDVTALQRHLADLETLSEADFSAADVDSNGLDISDATNIQRFLAEFDNIHHIGEWVDNGATEPSSQPPTYYWFKPGDNELPFVPN